MNNFYISGIPSTGKSTLIGTLKKRYGDGCLFVPEFLEPLPEFVYKADNEGLAGKCRAQEWVIDQYCKKNQLVASEQNGRPAIIERGLVDALAFSWALGKEVFEHTVQYAESFPWTPGKIILLEAPECVVKERIIQRDKLTLNEWNTLWQPFFSRVAQGYKVVQVLRTENQYLAVDTNKTLEEAQREITQLFDGLFAGCLEGLPSQSRK